MSADLIRAAIARLLDDPAERGRLRAAGRVRAARNSWKRTATELRGVLRALSGVA
jgi:glycosyltransferase involved in cell wall biosynthesis